MLSDHELISSLSMELANSSEQELIGDIALPKIKTHTQAVYIQFSLYNSEKKELSVNKIDSDLSVLKTITRLIGEKIFYKSNPISDSDYLAILNNKIIQSNSLHDISFGTISKAAEKSIKTILGLSQFISVAHIHSGKLYGTTFFAFKKEQKLPNDELIKAYSNIMAVSIRNRRAENAHKESEANLKAITENTLESIWSVDSNYNLVYINGIQKKAYKNIFGVELKIGDNVLDQMPELYKDKWKEHYDRALNNEQFVIKEAIESSDHKIYINVSFNPIVVDEKIIGVSLFGKDITEAKIAEKNLIEAKEKAEESDRLKSAFLANMSHEIRTPMNGIIGFSDLIKNQELSNDERIEYINLIQESGKRLMGIIDDLINISKIESGLMTMNISEVNLREVISFMNNFFRTETSLKGLTFSVSALTDIEDLTIISDKEKIYAILTNLIKNAIKFTEAGSIKVTCNIQNDKILFTVKDTGIGIPKSKQTVIFDRFVQANSSLSSSYDGWGLGLSITKAYVNMLNGEIWMDSIEHRGTSFYFTIPKTFPTSSSPRKIL